MNNLKFMGPPFIDLQILCPVNHLILIFTRDPDNLLEFLQMFPGNGIFIRDVFHAGSAGRTEASGNGHDLRRKPLAGAVFLKSCGTEM